MFLTILATRIKTSTTSSVSRTIFLKRLVAGLSGKITAIPSVQALRTLGNFYHTATIESMNLRKLENHQRQGLHLHSSPKLITKKTGCYKPCSYRKYSLIGDHQKPPNYINFTDGFMLWSFTDDIMVGETKDYQLTITKLCLKG